MKKILVLFMVLAMCVSAVSCGGTNGNNGGSDVSDIGASTDDKAPDSNKNDEGDKAKPAELTEEYVRSYKVAPASDFEYEIYGDECEIYKYIGTDDVVVIPETIDGKPVTYIAKLIFANDSNVRGALIPKNVKELEATFGNNECIEVVICEGVDVLGANVFNSCSNLKNVVVGDSLVELGNCCFAFCNSLDEIYLPPSVTEISDNNRFTVFAGCDNLTIIGESGSYIETFATEMGINFRAK